MRGAIRRLTLPRWRDSPLLVAALTGIVGLLGGALGSYASLQGTEKQIRAEADRQVLQAKGQRIDEARKKRATVYAEYLDDANAYSVSVNAIIDDALSKSAKVPADDVNKWMTARNKYQGGINQLYIYGSDAAWKAHELLASTMPSSLGKLTIAPIDQSKFLAAYRGFQQVMCREVPAEPRDDC
jgi:hypothetical protein